LTNTWREQPISPVIGFTVFLPVKSAGYVQSRHTGSRLGRDDETPEEEQDRLPGLAAWTLAGYAEIGITGQSAESHPRQAIFFFSGGFVIGAKVLSRAILGG
jgi:hypothetical protein